MKTAGGATVTRQCASSSIHKCSRVELSEGSLHTEPHITTCYLLGSSCTCAHVNADVATADDDADADDADGGDGRVVIMYFAAAVR